jgi:hypothetical protein
MLLFSLAGNPRGQLVDWYEMCKLNHAAYALRMTYLGPYP